MMNNDGEMSSLLRHAVEGVPAVTPEEIFLASRRRKGRRKVSLVAAACLFTVGATTAGVVALAPARAPVAERVAAGARNDEQSSALLRLAAEAQSLKQAKFFPLEDWSKTVDGSDVVGVGTLDDVRFGYSTEIADGVVEPTLLIVVRPSRLLKGSDTLGQSGLVYIEQEWSPAFPVSSIRKSLADASANTVLFALTRDDRDLTNDPYKDAFAGRDKDDPLFWGTRASSVVGIAGTTAFPIFTDEDLQVTSQFKQLADNLGLDVTDFAIVDVSGEPTLDPPSVTTEPE